MSVIRIALSVAIVALATSAAADGIGFKTDWLLKNCKAKNALCAGYVGGVVDTYLALMAVQAINKVFCFPGPISVGQEAEIFVRHAEVDPSNLDGEASIAVMDSLSKTFPCKSAN